MGVGIGVASDATAMQRRQGQGMNNVTSFVIVTDGLTKRFGDRVAVDRVGSTDDSVSPTIAVVALAAWTLIPLAVGAGRTARRDA